MFSLLALIDFVRRSCFLFPLPSFGFSVHVAQDLKVTRIVSYTGALTIPCFFRAVNKGHVSEHGQVYNDITVLLSLSYYRPTKWPIA